MTHDEIKAKLSLIATAVVTPDGEEGQPAVLAGYEAGFDLIADAFVNLGRIADALEAIAQKFNNPG